MDSTLTIKEILGTKKNGDFVNLKEIAANDNSGMVKTTLCASRINDIPLDRVYKDKSAIVDEYNDNKSLNTNRQTVFALSDHNI